MNQKIFNGKAIYQPKGKAGEYAKWACNFFTGCSNNCLYCYCKRGVMSHVWDNAPHLKKCFKNEGHAIDVYIAELEKNQDSLQEHGLFFSFTTDPMLPETLDFHINAICLAMERHIPVQVLTKRADFLDCWIFNPDIVNQKVKDMLVVGFTLTGYDELEPHASRNVDRIKAMIELHKRGFKTFASIEPVVNAPTAYSMINAISGICDLIKVGLMSGKRNYKDGEIQSLYQMIKSDVRGSKFYLKDSMIDYLNLDRAKLPSNCVAKEFNIFKQ